MSGCTQRPHAPSPVSPERGQSLVEFALIVPLMLFLVVAIGDFGRLYASAVAIESAAREAADYGAFLGGGRWDETDGATIALNVAEMNRRACTAASGLTDYEEPGGTANHATCTNPSFAFDPLSPTDLIHPPGLSNCRDAQPTHDPCRIHVRVTFAFHMILSFPPLPATMTIVRDSTFAISDLTGS